jgi:hypothetical protein
MSSGWGCQHLTTHKQEKDWCKLLKLKCDPNCKGCVLYGKFTFSTSMLNVEEDRPVKVRCDNPLG